MTADQKIIIDYLKGWPKLFVSGREIARKAAGKRRYERDRGWAAGVLMEMVDERMLETDSLGAYRLRNAESTRTRSYGRHVSPQILRILKDSGKSLEGIVIDEDENDTEEPAA